MAENTSAYVSGAATGAATGFMVGGPAGAAVGAGVGAVGAHQGIKAAKEQEKKQKAALEAAKKLTTTSTQDTSSTQSSEYGSSQSTQTQFTQAGKTERELQQASIANFKAQQGLVNQAEAEIRQRQGLQAGAQETLGGVLGGEAFALTGSEQARINALREANIAAGSSAVDRMLDERLGALQADAARRGIRGQAASQLQTGALNVAAESLDRQTLEANRIASEQALSMPGQRVGIQAQTAGNFATFADAARQQAIQNRQLLQDPIALQQLRDERLKGGVTHNISAGTNKATQTGSTNASATGQGAAGILQAMAGTPGPGASGFAGAMGAIGAAGQAAGGLAQARSAFNQSEPSSPTTRLQPTSPTPAQQDQLARNA